MNLNSLYSQIELKLSYEKQQINLWIEKTQNFFDIQQMIKKSFNIDSNVSIDLLVGKFYINNFLSSVSFEKLTEIFFTNRFIVVLSSQNQMNIKNSRSIPSEIKNLNPNILANECQNLLTSLGNLLEVEESTKLSIAHLNEVYIKEENKAKFVDYGDVKDDDLNNSDIIEDDDEILELKEMIENEASELEKIEEILEINFGKIINYKNLEKDALKFFRENRRIIGNIHNNNQLIEDIQDANKKLELKSNLQYL